MPRITEVTYGRVKNLGNYQTERCEVRVEVAEGEDAVQAMIVARSFVLENLGYQVPQHVRDAAREA